MPDPTKELTIEHNAFVEAAWTYGHDQATKLHGEAHCPGFFTGERGNRLMQGLDTMPLGTPYEHYQVLVDAEMKAGPAE